MIKSIFWNIRGINKKIALSRLKTLKKTYSLSMIGLCEPRVEASRIKEFQLKLGYHKALCNQANRIWIFFDSEFLGTIISESDQYIAILFSHTSFSVDFMCIFVHAHCCISERKILWTDLSSIIKADTPVFIQGDFNVILNADEKKGGNLFSPNESLDFLNFISTNSLVDIGFNGSNFTWCNNRSYKNRIWKRLDRVLVNSAWLDLPVNSSVLHLARVGSDHSPLLISITSKSPHQKQFRFLNLWASHPDFLNLVKETWRVHCSGSHFYKLIFKLKAL